ncbi:hypothetical protein N7539_007591 [Penicillium diatomitis]|uniref:NAD(P)-binding domain-containing protein n=1 Tax=Penicillium diatomitis TaxID=2819901 RepID=A0A9W9WVJ4_9EURO|nr:uncharacterized protein N7539_007591 [Penicillium diatomitis]KAJ5477447.1 hypothetical protein N7539_007591 [Penicillium diatomitis]
MHALIIGGSGRTGKLVVEELLKREHRVTALIRNPTSMKDFGRIDVVKGISFLSVQLHSLRSPTELADVRQAFAHRVPDVVVVTLNSPRASESPFAAPVSPPRLMADSNANVVTAMKEFGVKKVVIMQAFGVGASWPNMACLLRVLMSKTNMSYTYDDHNMTDQEVRESGVTYVMVRPSRLVETEIETVKEWPENGKGVPMMASTSRKSVARFLVDAAETSRWDNTAPVISN